MVTKNIASSVLKGRVLPLGELLNGADNGPAMGEMEAELSHLRMENTNLRVELEYAYRRAMITNSTWALMVPAGKYHHARDTACAMRAANRKLKTLLEDAQAELENVHLKLDTGTATVRILQQQIADLETDLWGDSNDSHRMPRLLKKRITRAVDRITGGELDTALDLLDGVVEMLDRAVNGGNQEENRRNGK